MTKFENDTLQKLLVMKEKELRQAAEQTANEHVKAHLIETADKFNKLFHDVNILEMIDFMCL